jgi:poly(3-hydroxyalkanoate) depolymerase
MSLVEKVSMASKSEAPAGMREFETSMMSVGGRTLRVAVWKAKPAKSAAAHRPILFFNGIGANIELMTPLADWFPDRDVVTFDMPGVGKSPAPLFPYRPSSMAWRMTRLLDKLGYDKVDVMGVSWGGGMAQQFAFQHPSRVGKVILAATSAGMVMVPGRLASLSKMASPRRYIDPEYMQRNFRTLYGGETEGAGDHASRLSAPSRLGYLYQLFAMIGWTSAFFLPLLRQKTLVLMGDADNIVPLANGHILSTLIPRARLEIVPGGGHLFLVSRAKEVAPLIEAFLNEPDSGMSPHRSAA